MTSSTLVYEIQGRSLTLPVRVRDADSWAAQFFVPARAAQAIVAPTGLEVAQPIPGRAVFIIAFVTYRDTDLDAYNEVALTFLVRPHGARPASRFEKMREFFKRDSGIYIHHLPVTQGFTLEAGQRIWGFPKFLADIDITHESGRVTCSLAHEGQYVLTIELREGGPIKLSDPNLPNYSFRDGILRRSSWVQDGQIRARLGGARLELGSHPIADELRSLGLPKRALMSSTMRNMSATFGAAEAV